MSEIIECCNHKQIGRVYQIDPKVKMWRALVFLDECLYCGCAVAEIKECGFNNKIKTTVRRSGRFAVELLEKNRNVFNKVYRIRSGSKENEFTFYNKFGTIFNFNDRIVGKNEDFKKVV